LSVEALSPAIEQAIAPLDSSSRAALLSPEKSLQGIISGKMNNLGNQDMRVMLRRQVLQQILGVISLSQVLSFSPLAFEKPTSSIEDYLSQCEENIFAWRKNLDLTCTHLQEGVQGAVRLRSEKRFHDSLTLYRQAHALWPHEQSLLELEELFH